MKFSVTHSREALLISLLAIVAAFVWYANPASSPAPSPAAPAPAAPAAPTSSSTGQAPSPGVSTTFRIAGEVAVPRLGIKAPLAYVEQADERVFQQALEHGVVHYPGTADPGSVGNVFIFGHSSDYRYRSGGYKTIFASLPKVAVGDQIVVTVTSGTKFNYTVTGTEVVATNDTRSLSQATGGKKLLTLQTSYPVGTALKRYLVFAELAPSTP